MRSAKRAAFAVAVPSALAILLVTSELMTCRAKIPPPVGGKSVKLGAGAKGHTTIQNNASIRYTVVDLGAPPIAKGEISARGMSPDGRYVVGSYSDGYNYRAYRWEAGTFTDLSQPRQFAYAEAVNDAGYTVGDIVDLDTELPRALLWKDGKQHDLLEDKHSHATKIDRKGNIYGDTTPKGASGWRAFIRDPKGRVQYLKDDSATSTYYQCSNEKGQVALSLYYGDAPKEKQLALWTGKAFQGLPSPLKERECRAFGMNDRAEVVGMVEAGDNPYRVRPVLWKNRKPTLLNVPEQATALAVSINNRGDIVGDLSTLPGYKRRPFLIQNGKFAYLQDLVETSVLLRKAIKINDQGVILVEGEVDKKTRVFLLKPVSR